MKIYGARKRYESWFDEFLGQDIWVKVKQAFWGDEGYIRIQSNANSSYFDNAYFVNWIDVMDVVYQVKYDDVKLHEVLNVQYLADANTYKLVEPMDCLSTFELTEMITERVKASADFHADYDD